VRGLRQDKGRGENWDKGADENKLRGPELYSGVRMGHSIISAQAKKTISIKEGGKDTMYIKIGKHFHLNYLGKDEGYTGKVRKMIDLHLCCVSEDCANSVKSGISL